MYKVNFTRLQSNICCANLGNPRTARKKTRKPTTTRSGDSAYHRQRNLVRSLRLKIVQLERDYERLRLLVGEDLLEKSSNDTRVVSIFRTINAMLDGEKVEEPQSSFLLNQVAIRK